jgi:serine/threonine-protein kinase RIM15
MAESAPVVEPDSRHASAVAKEVKPTPANEATMVPIGWNPKYVPAISSLGIQTYGSERSLNHNIQEEREELREAAERTLNTIVDLNLDCTVKWASPSWIDVVGTLPESIKGCPFSELIVSDNKTVFRDVVESMRRDDSRSHRVRFAIALGPLSKLLPLENQQPVNTYHDNGEGHDDEDGISSADGGGHDENGEKTNAPVDVVANVIDIEAQGIMVYDNASGGESHVSDHH